MKRPRGRKSYYTKLTGRSPISKRTKKRFFADTKGIHSVDRARKLERRVSRGVGKKSSLRK